MTPWQIAALCAGAVVAVVAFASCAFVVIVAWVNAGKGDQ